jgi:sulfide:quinone oxidoreductase
VLPEENAIVLRNGRRIAYDHLVLANGMSQDVESITGMEEAWKDLDHPVFT